MTHLTLAELREQTLRRQFPPAQGTGADAVVALFTRLGPIQSQVPRAPFLAASSRLPGTTHGELCALFEQQRLIKTTSLRGTVHTTARSQYAAADAVARRGRAALLRSTLALQRVTPEALVAEVEAYASGAWRSRQDLVAHLRAWLTEHESAASAARLTPTLPESLVWGHSGLLRRPRDDRWEKRTDTYHRRTRELAPDLPARSYEESVAALVRVYLGAYGPATRGDAAYFLGVPLGAVDAALRTLGDHVRPLRGPAGEPLLDLADHETVAVDPGVRLLPEFDGLLVGYSRPHRARFVTEDELGQVWGAANGQFLPVVLRRDRVVATWRTVTAGRRTNLEVRMLPGHQRLAEDDLAAPVADTARALDLDLRDLRVATAGPPGEPLGSR